MGRRLPAVEVLIVNIELTLLSGIVQTALNNFSLRHDFTNTMFFKFQERAPQG